MRTSLATPMAARTPFATVRDLIALGKPRITFMVLVTTAAGLWLAPHPLATPRAVGVLIGMAVVVAAANAFNMYLERDIDALMARTRDRPLPSRRLEPEISIAFGLFGAVLALPLVRLAGNPLSAALALLSLLLYVFVYTPLKRRSPLALVVGAVPGAMPALIGWTASSGHIEAPGLALFAVLFVWQIPHFIAISIFRADDYRRAGLKVVAVERGARAASFQIAAWSLVQILASLAIFACGVAGRGYLIVALGLNLVLAVLAALGLRDRTRDQVERWSRLFFLYSLVYLPVLFTALVLGRR